MQLGLGNSESEEVETELHKLSGRITGQCGLLFTDKAKEEVLEWFKNYSALEYARSGHVAPETVVLQPGPQEEFCHSIEPHIRKLGLPSKLDKGEVVLYKEYKVCKKGQILTPEQARILKLIAMPIATFRLTIKCRWSKTGGFESFIDTDDDETVITKEKDDENMEEDDDEDESEDEEVDEN